MKWTTHKPAEPRDRWLSLQMTERDAEELAAELTRLRQAGDVLGTDLTPLLAEIDSRVSTFLARPDDRELSKGAR